MALTGNYRKKLFLLAEKITDQLVKDCEGNKIDCKIVLWEAQNILAKTIDKMKEGENEGIGKDDSKGIGSVGEQSEEGNSPQAGERTLPTNPPKAEGEKGSS